MHLWQKSAEDFFAESGQQTLVNWTGFQGAFQLLRVISICKKQFKRYEKSCRQLLLPSIQNIIHYHRMEGKYNHINDTNKKVEERLNGILYSILLRVDSSRSNLLGHFIQMFGEDNNDVHNFQRVHAWYEEKGKKKKS